MVNGEKVCRNAFLAVFGISRRSYQQVLKEYLRGSIKALCMPTSRTITAKTADAEAWMAKYFESISDRMPHNGQLHLPHFLSKRDVYNIMKRQMENQKLPTISLQHFYATWAMKFKNVVIPKVVLVHVFREYMYYMYMQAILYSSIHIFLQTNLFSKCDLCTKYTEERAKGGRDKKSIEQNMTNILNMSS